MTSVDSLLKKSTDQKRYINPRKCNRQTKCRLLASSILPLSHKRRRRYFEKRSPGPTTNTNRKPVPINTIEHINSKDGSVIAFSCVQNKRTGANFSSGIQSVNQVRKKVSIICIGQHTDFQIVHR